MKICQIPRRSTLDKVFPLLIYLYKYLDGKGRGIWGSINLRFSGGQSSPFPLNNDMTPGRVPESIKVETKFDVGMSFILIYILTLSPWGADMFQVLQVLVTWF